MNRNQLIIGYTHSTNTLWCIYLLDFEEVKENEFQLNLLNESPQYYDNF